MCVTVESVCGGCVCACVREREKKVPPSRWGARASWREGHRLGLYRPSRREGEREKEKKREVKGGRVGERE